MPTDTSTTATAAAARDAAVVVKQTLISSLSQLIGFMDYAFLLLKLLGPCQPKFFGKGYGDLQLCQQRMETVWQELENQKKQQQQKQQQRLVIEWGEIQKGSHSTLQHGTFPSPLAKELPKESSICHFHLVRPNSYYEKYNNNHEENDDSSIYVFLLPATGEMDITRRLMTARKLARQYGWSSIILTAPYYANRKPKDQTFFFLDSVQDLLLQAQGVAEEAFVLATYFLSLSSSCTSKVCFTGFSLGAAMAAFTSTFCLKAGLDGKRMACALYVGSPSPCALADGMIQNAIDWKSLRNHNQEHHLDTVQALMDVLSKTQLNSILQKEEEEQEQKKSVVNQLAIVKGCAMEHDAVLPKKYAINLEQQVQDCLYESFQMEWHMGGHAFAAMSRPFLHHKLIVDTVQALEAS